MDKHTVTSIHIHCDSWYKRTKNLESLSIYTTQVALYLIIHVFGAQALKCQQTVFCTKPGRRSRSLLLSFRKVQEEMGREEEEEEEEEEQEQEQEQEKKSRRSRSRSRRKRSKKGRRKSRGRKSRGRWGGGGGGGGGGGAGGKQDRVRVELAEKRTEEN